MHQNVMGLIPGQDTYLDCGFDPGWDMYERQHISLTLTFLSLSPSSLSKINKKYTLLTLAKVFFSVNETQDNPSEDSYCWVLNLLIRQDQVFCGAHKNENAGGRVGVIVGMRTHL